MNLYVIVKILYKYISIGKIKVSVFHWCSFLCRVLWKKNEVADYEATTFSIFYNNALYLVLLIVSSFYVLKNFNPLLNYGFSVAAAAGLLALFSTSSKA